MWNDLLVCYSSVKVSLCHWFSTGVFRPENLIRSLPVLFSRASFYWTDATLLSPCLVRNPMTETDPTSNTLLPKSPCSPLTFSFLRRSFLFDFLPVCTLEKSRPKTYVRTRGVVLLSVEGLSSRNRIGSRASHDSPLTDFSVTLPVYFIFLFTLFPRSPFTRSQHPTRHESYPTESLWSFRVTVETKVDREPYVIIVEGSSPLTDV